MSQAAAQPRMPALLANDREIGRNALWTIRLIMAPIVVVGLLAQTSVAGVFGAVVGQIILYWFLLRIASTEGAE